MWVPRVCEESITEFKFPMSLLIHARVCVGGGGGVGGGSMGTHTPRHF